MSAAFSQPLQLGVDATSSGIINNVFPYFVIVIFLFFGFSLGLQTSAMGASAAIELGRRVGTAAAIRGGQGAIGAARAVPAISRAEERLRKKLETTPVVGRFVGGPGAYEKWKQERLKEARTEMEAIPATLDGNKALLSYVTRRPLTQKDRDQRIAAIETLAKRKELTNTVIPHLREFQQFGGNIADAYKARPDFAPHFTITDPTTGQLRPMTTEEVVTQKVEPRELCKTIQKEALRHGDVIIHLSEKDRIFDQITKHLKPELKREFKATLLNPNAPVSSPPTPQQAAKISQRINQIPNMPEWQV